MTRAIIRLRRASEGEEGFTLVELIVAMSLMMLVLAVFFAGLIAVQRAVAGEDKRSQSNDQARLAIEQIDREVRSANYVYNPASESVPGQMLRIYTQTNATTRSPAPGYMCVLWQITADNTLQTRYWPPTQPAAATPWRTVATGVVNRSVSPAVQAFSLDTDPLKGYNATSGTSRTVNVVFLANAYLSTVPNGTVRIEVAMTGRGTSYGFPPAVCTQLPP
jgi:Tfp pilus assembly protein PilW